MDVDKAYHSAVKGDEDIRRQLFEWLSVRFRLFARQKIWNKSDVEDVVQNALAAVHSKYKQVNIVHSFSAWAHGVLGKEILRYTRNRSRRSATFTSLEAGSEPHAIGTEDPEVRRRLLSCLEKVASANPRYAKVLQLTYEGYDTDYICKSLGITPNNLYVILSRARTMLKKCLKERTLK
ncbi:MAG: sigma-70 family RNA polymerase sigma factor [Candidatus Zixiibacteriota bacterium]|nr:MAG: sigma-70 family RNA polymerase sigma factor [candidate division Zixibacteria bacterium]